MPKIQYKLDEFTRTRNAQRLGKLNEMFACAMQHGELNKSKIST